MDREQNIRAILTESLNPTFLDVIDESHMHSGPRQQTHFRVVIVSEAFLAQSKVSRQRLVYGLLKAELNSGLHALALRTLTPEEWQSEGGVDSMSSPVCHGSRGKG